MRPLGKLPCRLPLFLLARHAADRAPSSDTELATEKVLAEPLSVLVPGTVSVEVHGLALSGDHQRSALPAASEARAESAAPVEWPDPDWKHRRPRKIMGR